MNDRQREVQLSMLQDEQEYIRILKETYRQASKDCENKIRELSARTDLENIQSIVYQQQYQMTIKKQIDEALMNLQNNEYSSMNDYLENCYTNSFTGTLYDLHGQGVPVLFPIDQSQVAKAVQLDSAISVGLYTRLGEDVLKLKDNIRSQVSRGIASGSTWNQTATEIAMGMRSPFNKAYNNAVRIARTEGHRIQNQAQADTLKKAKSKGADVVKQWDSTLDDVTRDTHKQLDGQIRECDEPFEVNGKTAMQPGGFGDPAEDCNCRCCMLQRAKWALDESELRELESRAEYFGLEKAESFEDFKNKYLNGVKNGGIINSGGKITDTNFMHIEKFERQAEQFYNARVRNGNNDVQSISKNTGFSYDDVLAIKNHVMIDKHLFSDGSVRKFDPNIDQALAWQRLMENNFKDSDILLLNHELRELRYMQSTGCDYETAHRYATQKYDWQSVIDSIIDKDNINPDLLK